MNLPNAITLARLIGCVGFVGLFSAQLDLAAFSVYLLLEILDQADGKAATYFRQQTPAGAHFDAFADGVTHITVFACLLSAGMVPLVAFLILFVREFGLMFVRLLAAAQRREVSGRWPGKVKAATHACVILLCLAERSHLIHLWFPVGRLVWFAVLASVVSGVVYFFRYRGVLRTAFLVERQ